MRLLALFLLLLPVSSWAGTSVPFSETYLIEYEGPFQGKVSFSVFYHEGFLFLVFDSGILNWWKLEGDLVSRGRVIGSLAQDDDSSFKGISVFAFEDDDGNLKKEYDLLVENYPYNPFAAKNEDHMSISFVGKNLEGHLK